MRRLLTIPLFVVAVATLALLLYLGDYSLLPAEQSKITLLYTGDVGGRVTPCKG